eukprot:15456860-Alexandrium_andersonii.AAC.1
MAAWAVRFVPSASRPCNTARSRARASPGVRPSLRHRRHTRFMTSGDELARRVGLRTKRFPPPADAGQGTRIPNRH